MYGIIDIGSNTIRLKVYKYEKNKLKSLVDKKEFAKLISYRSDNIISQEGIDVCVNTLIEYKKLLKALRVSSIYAFATAPFRGVKNIDDVLMQIKERADIEVDVLSGEDEALLSFIGASSDIQFDNGAVLDIGGGSLELTFFDNKTIQSRKSIACGSLNMKIDYLKDDSLLEFDTKAMKKRIIEELSKQGIVEKNDVIYGVGGAIRALLKIKRSETNDLTNEFDLEDVKRWYKMLKLSPNNWLKIVLNVVPERVYTISCGLIILKTIMKHIEAKKVVVSSTGVREGYLIQIINEEA